MSMIVVLRSRYIVLQGVTIKCFRKTEQQEKERAKLYDDVEQAMQEERKERQERVREKQLFISIHYCLCSF